MATFRPDGVFHELPHMAGASARIAEPRRLGADLMPLVLGALGVATEARRGSVLRLDAQGQHRQARRH
ncbi:MAG TPA: hypothetical protein VMV23_00070 [Candidatus Nanopelagicaceae bacterium]|nr:hypothetical protein [Candidatus Nanopelagicaceae bacterium]